MKCTRALNNSWSIVHPKLRRSRSVLARRVSRSLVLLHCVACPSSGVHCCSTTSESSSSSAMRGEWRSDARPPSTMVPRREGTPGWLRASLRLCAPNNHVPPRDVFCALSPKKKNWHTHARSQPSTDAHPAAWSPSQRRSHIHWARLNSPYCGKRPNSCVFFLTRAKNWMHIVALFLYGLLPVYYLIAGCERRWKYVRRKIMPAAICPVYRWN